MQIFGPVPSRRLGRSLGINNIPPKQCSYACIYCQIGRTPRLTIRRQAMYEPDQLAAAAAEKLEQLQKQGENADYLTIVPEGEPTLDINLGRLLTQLRRTGLKTAVITNSSLLTDRQVRSALMTADWVSVKIDTVSERLWKKINRPHGHLSLPEIKRGIREFSSRFKGTLVTETMLVDGINDDPESLQQTAAFIASLAPDTAFIAVPTRPPAEKEVLPPTDTALDTAWRIFSREIRRVEYLIGYEGNAFSSTGDLARDLLSITAVHPMRQDAVDALIKKCRGSRETVAALISSGLIRRTEYKGETYYSRTLRTPGNDPALGVRSQ